MRAASRILCAAAILSMCWASPALAGFINGDFESGLSGWNMSESAGTDVPSLLSQVATASLDGSSYVLQADTSLAGSTAAGCTAFDGQPSHQYGAYSDVDPMLANGSTHTISFWARLIERDPVGQNAWDNQATTYLSFERIRGGGYSYQALLTTNWQHYTISVPMSHDTTTFVWSLIDQIPAPAPGILSLTAVTLKWAVCGRWTISR